MQTVSALVVLPHLLIIGSDTREQSLVMQSNLEELKWKCVIIIVANSSSVAVLTNPMSLSACRSLARVVLNRFVKEGHEQMLRARARIAEEITRSVLTSGVLIPRSSWKYFTFDFHRTYSDNFSDIEDANSLIPIVPSFGPTSLSAQTAGETVTKVVQHAQQGIVGVQYTSIQFRLQVPLQTVSSLGIPLLHSQVSRTIISLRLEMSFPEEGFHAKLVAKVVSRPTSLTKIWRYKNTAPHGATHWARK